MLCTTGDGAFASPPVVHSDFSHLPLCQYINHDLGSQPERVDKSLTIGENIDLPLGGHVVLEQFLLLFGEGVGQRVPGSHNFVQRLGVLAVALEAALAGANIAEIKIFQNQHLRSSSAVDELVQDDLFHPVPIAKAVG